jgi:hypothetical protein
MWRSRLRFVKLLLFRYNSSNVYLFFYVFSRLFYFHVSCIFYVNTLRMLISFNQACAIKDMLPLLLTYLYS